METTVIKPNVRTVNKWHGYYLEDCNCAFCLYYASIKVGCTHESCMCEEEKREAIAAGRTIRKRGSMEWDG